MQILTLHLQLASTRKQILKNLQNLIGFSPLGHSKITKDTKVNYEIYLSDVILVHFDLIIAGETVYKTQHFMPNGGINQGINPW